MPVWPAADDAVKCATKMKASACRISRATLSICAHGSQALLEQCRVLWIALDVFQHEPGLTALDLLQRLQCGQTRTGRAQVIQIGLSNRNFQVTRIC